MNKSQYNIFIEINRLIAQYDWAVEGFSSPEGTAVSRTEAVKIRNGLVKLSAELGGS